MFQKTPGKLEKISSSEHLEGDQSASVNHGDGSDSSEVSLLMESLVVDVKNLDNFGFSLNEICSHKILCESPTNCITQLVQNYAHSDPHSQSHHHRMNHKNIQNIQLKNFQPDARMRILPDLNFYQNKKTLGTGMIDFALLVSNVNQLRYILNMNEKEHPAMYVSAGLVVSSIVLQIIVGVCLTVNCRYDIKDNDEVRKAEKCNNWSTVLIFLITTINVVISGLGIADM